MSNDIKAKKTTYEVLLKDGNPMDREVIRLTIPWNYNPRPVIEKLWPQATKFRQERMGYYSMPWMDVR